MKGVPTNLNPRNKENLKPKPVKVYFIEINQTIHDII